MTQITCAGTTYRGARAASGLKQRVRNLALAGIVRPGALHRVGTVPHADIRRGALAAANPGALIAVLLSGGGGPAAGRILIGEGLGVLVAADDRKAVERSRGTRVDEARSTAAA